MADRMPPELDNEIKCVQAKGNHFIQAVKQLSDEEILSSIRKVYLEGTSSPKFLCSQFPSSKNVYFCKMFIFHQTAAVK